MTADAALVGAAIGLGVGIVDFVVLGMLARQTATGASGPLRLVRAMSLVVFPIVGWFAGPLVASSLAG